MLRSTRAAACAVALLGLAGCAGTSPAPHPAPSALPSLKQRAAGLTATLRHAVTSVRWPKGVSVMSMTAPPPGSRTGLPACTVKGTAREGIDVDVNFVESDARYDPARADALGVALRHAGFGVGPLRPAASVPGSRATRGDSAGGDHVVLADERLGIDIMAYTRCAPGTAPHGMSSPTFWNVA